VTERLYENVGKLTLRLSLGCVILFHGLSKLGDGGSLRWIGNQLSDAGLPEIFAYGVYLGEIVAPLMIIAGVYCRIGGVIIVINMLFAVLLGKERLRARKAIASVVAFAGVYLVVNDSVMPKPSVAGGEFLGDVLFVFIAAVWALFGLLSRPYVIRLGAWTTTGWAALFGALILLPIAGPGLTDGSWLQLDFGLVLAFLHLSLIVGCLGNAAWAGGLGRLGLASMVLYLYLSPVVGAAFSAIFLGDWLSPAQGLGAALVIGGVALGQSGGAIFRRRPAGV